LPDPEPSLTGPTSTGITHIHPSRPPGPLKRFLLAQGPDRESGHEHERSHPWSKVLWLTGMDYFSTLGYQPGIAFLAAGVLSPLATATLVLVTLAGALPIYTQVAKRSYAGQGSISMLENLLTGWFGKVFVLALLGFASTDFVITMTLSAADAAQHAVENPYLHAVVGDHRMAVTLLLLALLACVFLRGFEEAIGVAMAVGLPYLCLNGVVMVAGAWHLLHHPGQAHAWGAAVWARGNWPALLLGSALIFPKLALGMSGFETGVSVMPLIEGDPAETGVPHTRIKATRNLLLTAALIMGVALIGSSLVTTMIIPPEAFAPGGKANGRALAYLAHALLGNGFGTVYDLSTISILWFAGASAMAGLLALIPRYLPRFGMAPRWVLHKRPLVLLLFGIDVVVTVIFNADVDAQGGAYATGVLVLMTSAAVAVALALWREKRHLPSLYFWLLTIIFTYTLVDNVFVRPDGVIIASIFIVAVLVLSFVSRWLRAIELRVENMVFADPESEALFAEMRGKKVSMVPLAHFTPKRRERKALEIHELYRVVPGPLAFINVQLADDTSEFTSEMRVAVTREGPNYLVRVHGAVAIANGIAFVSEQLDPIAIFLQLTQRNNLEQALKYLLWGEGETGIMVYEILVHYWDSTPEEDVRPMLFLMSA